MEVFGCGCFSKEPKQWGLPESENKPNMMMAFKSTQEATEENADELQWKMGLMRKTRSNKAFPNIYLPSPLSFHAIP